MNATAANPWDFFPLAMCINLKNRDDRLNEARGELQRVGLQRVVFYRAERQEDREKGCIDSHMACLKYAVEQGVPHVLMFEDDVLFQEGHIENMNRVVEFLRDHPECDFLHLGGFIFRKAERYGPNFIRGGILCTHGYVVRTEYAKKILAERPRFFGMSVDVFLTILNRNSAFVHVHPLVCIQRPSDSDGTWDKRNLGQSGWLGQAMIYTALDYPERLRFNHFPLMERIRIENGISFFKVYRHAMKLKVALARRKQVDTGVPVGEFVIEELHPRPSASS